MNAIYKVASLKAHEIGNKRPKKPYLIWKVAMPSMGLITNKGIPHPNQPKNTALPLVGGEGKQLVKTVKKDLEVYRPMSDKRKIRAEQLRLTVGTGESNTAGRRMKPGRMVLSNSVGGSIREMKSGQPKLTLSTGGLRKMKPGQMVQRDDEGKKA